MAAELLPFLNTFLGDNTLPLLTSVLDGDTAALARKATDLALANPILLNVLIIGVPIVLVVVLIAVLFGFIDLGKDKKGKTDYDYSYDYDPTPDYSSYSNYAQRSLSMVAPILRNLQEAYQKYN